MLLLPPCDLSRQQRGLILVTRNPRDSTPDGVLRVLVLRLLGSAGQPQPVTFLFCMLRAVRLIMAPGYRHCPCLSISNRHYPQVLFCRLTSYQRRLYGEFLESSEVKSVLSRTMRAFRAIGILRKICNHPDLVCRFGDSVVTRYDSGPRKKSRFLGDRQMC